MRGQILYDFVISLILFSLLLYTTYTTLIQLIIQPISSKPPQQAWVASELLLLPGEPKNWTDINEITVFGLGLYKNGTWRPNELDPKKLIMFNGSSCYDLSQKLGLPQDHEIAIKVIDPAKYKIYECKPRYNHSMLIIRYGMVNGRKVRIEVRA